MLSIATCVQPAGQPVGEVEQIPRHRAEGAYFLGSSRASSRREQTGDHDFLVYIEPTAPLVYDLHGHEPPPSELGVSGGRLLDRDCLACSRQYNVATDGDTYRRPGQTVRRGSQHQGAPTSCFRCVEYSIRPAATIFIRGVAPLRHEELLAPC